ncbi:hypothetical protein F5Y07DRAFT_363113 [Xylaria sp. FL0933]|nr:hypothetical protein F5Y07DRAFT_363113 [Xylaria sp. FL0933]
MLLRQLHRSLPRSVTAAWRRASTTTPSPASSRRGDSRSSSSSNTRQQKGNGNSSQAPMRRKPSLFEELFPENTKGTNGTSAPTHIFRDPEPPRLAVPEELQQHDEDAFTAQDNDDLRLAPSAHGAKSMLILSAASKNLLESDFLRLGVKGKHVEGWVGGIVKVIQARNPDTLEPKGRYYILFDSDAAAAAYKDRLTYLWRLGKAHIPGAHHALRHRHQQPLPLGLSRTPAGEDVAQLLRSFTLVPPSQKLLLQHPATPRPAPDLVEELRARAGSQFLVLVRLDGGRVTLDTLRRAVEEDGVRRNLAWRVTDLQNGILPFGKSIVKAKDRVQAQAEAEAEAQDQEAALDENTHGDDISTTDASSSSNPFEEFSKTTEGFRNEVDGSNESSNGDAHPFSPSSPSPSPYSGTSSQTMVTAVHEAEINDKPYRRYARFIIPFTDKEEAHRFVQNWHRRELKLLMGGRGTKDDPSWEESRIVNATVLW